MSLTLNLINIGEKAVVKSLSNPPLMKQRLLDLGITPGTDIECIHTDFSGNIKAFWVKGTLVAIRSEDSSKIFVEYEE